MSTAKLLRIQAISGIVFSLFVAVHMLNTAFALGGPESYNAFQRAARVFYQNPLVEIVLLLIPLGVHFAAALLRLERSGFRRPHLPWRARLHRYTGYYLLTVIVGHIAATRGPSLVKDFHPEFAGLSFSLWWVPALFYPYYALFVLSALYHAFNGLVIALRTFGLSVPQALRSGPGFWVPLAGCALALCLSILALGGVLFEIPDPTNNDYARMWHGLVGVDLGH